MRLVLISLLSFNLFAIDHAGPARSYFMGHAYSSIAEEAHSIFYNPALLARNKGLSFHPFNSTLVLPNVLKFSEELDSLSSEADEVYDTLSGIPLNLGYSFAPGFKFGNFGLSAIVHNQTTARFVNNVNPTLDLEYVDDRGFITGYAHEIKKNLNIGFAIKYIKRSSIDQNLSVTSTSMLDAIGGDDIDAILNSLGRVDSKGWSADFGIDYVNQKGASTFALGFAFQNIYSTMKDEESEEGLEGVGQELKLNISSAYRVKADDIFSFIVTTELKDAFNRYKSFMHKFHLGGELSLTPAFSLMAGYNDNAVSYGTRLNLMFLDIYVGLTEEPIGKRIDQGNKSSIVLYLSLLDFKFEP